MYLKHVLAWLGINAVAWGLCPESHHEPPADVHVHVVHHDFVAAYSSQVSTPVTTGSAGRDALRAVVRAETRRANELADTITDRQFKAKTLVTSRQIAEIETFFLDHEEHEERWISWAEQALSICVGSLRGLESAVAKFGTNLVTA